MTYPITANRSGAAAHAERLPPGIAGGVIAALSFVSWIPLISTGIAVWSAFA
jgi:hypothetical protein